MGSIAIFIALVFAYSLVSARLERTAVTAPILFTAAGMLAFLVLPEPRDRVADQGVFLTAAEIGLVLLLFTNASRADLRVLKRARYLPARLLSAGMLLTIVLGALAALACLRGLSIWEAGILAAILAPTDAGLGQVIVSSPRVPLRIREALSVEAGLNDGLSVPFLLFFVGMAGSGTSGERATLTRWHLLYALASLTVVRMLPVAIALAGTGLSRATVLFVGWFGPRGLASIVLGLVYLEQHAHHPGERTIRLAVMMTVLLSIAAHGSSATPCMRLYARAVETLPSGAPERDSAEPE